MLENPEAKISDLTIREFQQLIRKTVMETVVETVDDVYLTRRELQEAVAEVIVEFSMAAEAAEEAREQVLREAEMTDYLRSTMHGLPADDLMGLNKHLDD